MEGDRVVAILGAPVQDVFHVERGLRGSLLCEIVVKRMETPMERTKREMAEKEARRREKEERKTETDLNAQTLPAKKIKIEDVAVKIEEVDDGNVQTWLTRDNEQGEEKTTS
jgi:hypothetical protein